MLLNTYVTDQVIYTYCADICNCCRSMGESTETIQEYEELFAHRYTSEDHEYQQYRSRPADLPPIVEDWRSRGGGNHRGRDNR